MTFDDVANLRADTNLFSMGSGELLRALDAKGLVDEYTLQIHPLVLGSGTTLFTPGRRTTLALQRSVTTTTGVFIGQYRVTTAP